MPASSVGGKKKVAVLLVRLISLLIPETAHTDYGHHRTHLLPDTQDLPSIHGATPSRPVLGGRPVPSPLSFGKRFLVQTPLPSEVTYGWRVWYLKKIKAAIKIAS